MPTLYLLATLDTKGDEAQWVRRRLERLGVEVALVDTGCLGAASVKAEVSREQVFEASGKSLAHWQRLGDRGQAVEAAARGAGEIVRRAWEQGRLQGVMSLGGSAGTTIGAAAMRRLPLGVPKVMLSTLAAGDTRPYVGGKDLAMFCSVVDIAGLNRVSREVMGNAAAAAAGMVLHRLAPTPSDRPLIAASMFGVTTPCVDRARQILTAAGYEVLVFHATGSGGLAMEALIDDGLIAGVLDITTTELADELVGGALTAGPQRLTAAGRRGVPQVVSVGATDMVNFGAVVPERFRDRLLYRHNPTVTLMRTTAAESAAIGRDIREKVLQARGPVALLLPLRGVSAIDAAGQPFDDPAARRALFDELRRADAANVQILELDCHLNDPAFAEAAAGRLLQLMRKPGETHVGSSQP